MKIQPLGTRVIIEPVKTEERTKGGIYLPESAQEKENQGTVVAISDSIKECQFKIGDRVMFEKYSAKEILDDENKEKKLVVIDYKDVIAKME